MVYLEEATRRLFTNQDPATLTSLIQLMPDISYDDAFKKLRGTAHEVSWAHNKKDLVWDNCEEAIAACMAVSKVFRVDCARTLGVFLKVMFNFKPNKHGPDMLDEDEISDSLGDIDLRGREDASQVSKDDEAARGTDRISKGADRNPGGTGTDEPTAGG